MWPILAFLAFPCAFPLLSTHFQRKATEIQRLRISEIIILVENSSFWTFAGFLLCCVTCVLLLTRVLSSPHDMRKRNVMS